MEQKFKDILNEVNSEILDYQGDDLVEEGILDSILIMMMISKLEKEYSIYFDPDEIDSENFATAQSIWKLVEKHKGVE